MKMSIGFLKSEQGEFFGKKEQPTIELKSLWLAKMEHQEFEIYRALFEKWVDERATVVAG